MPPLSRSANWLAVTSRVWGTVRGEALRPFVYHLARRSDLADGVRNGAGGCSIRAEGSPEGPIACRESLRAES